MIFNIDFAFLITRAIPPKLRKTRLLAWLFSLLKPLVQLYSAVSVTNPIRYPQTVVLPNPSFLSFREYALLRSSLNGQTIVLERLLNLYYYSTFTPSNTKGTTGYWIYIQDEIDNLATLAVYLDAENLPLTQYLSTEFAPAPPLPNNATVSTPGPQYLYAMANYFIQNDFIVHIPLGLSFADIEIKELLNRHKIAASTYIINYY